MEGCDHRTLAPLAPALAPPTRRAAATVMTLNPAMSQQEMDTFLSSLGAGHNPFSVQTQHFKRDAKRFKSA